MNKKIIMFLISLVTWTQLGAMNSQSLLGRCSSSLAKYARAATNLCRFPHEPIIANKQMSHVNSDYRKFRLRLWLFSVPSRCLLTTLGAHLITGVLVKRYIPDTLMTCDPTMKLKDFLGILVVGGAFVTSLLIASAKTIKLERSLKWKQKSLNKIFQHHEIISETNMREKTTYGKITSTEKYSDYLNNFVQEESDKQGVLRALNSILGNDQSIEVSSLPNMNLHRAIQLRDAHKIRPYDNKPNLQTLLAGPEEIADLIQHIRQEQHQ